MKRTMISVFVLGFALLVWATGPMGKTFEAKYGVKAGSKLAAAKCGVCHASAKGGKLNPYGADLKTKMVGKKLTNENLAAVEGMDSDKDGKTNLAEIKADSLPGAK